MKTSLFLLLLLTLLRPASARSQGPAQPPLISISGTAEVKVVPDEIHLRVGVETRHENLGDAKKQNDERITKTLAFLKENQIGDRDIQTDYISIEPRFEDSLSRTKPVIYEVRKAIEIRLTKLEGFEGILSGLLTNGVTTVQGIDFRTTQLRKHRDTARAMAIRAAQEKADALASELGVKRGKVFSISANEWGGSWSPSSSYWGGSRFQSQNVTQNSGGESTSENGTLSLGQISVSASVNVSFLIE